MSKYIDADALKNDLYSIAKADYGYTADVLAGLMIAERVIDNAQTVDVVPVVHCRDCKHCRNLPNGLCYLHTEPSCNERGYKGEAVCVEPDDFCSYGKREETK